MKEKTNQDSDLAAVCILEISVLAVTRGVDVNLANGCQRTKGSFVQKRRLLRLLCKSKKSLRIQFLSL